jgi:uncharacterized protein (TIGR02246 family)
MPDGSPKYFGLSFFCKMQTDEQAIRELTATWMAATRVGDVEAVLGLMAEDVVFLVTGQSPMIGKPAYAALARPKPGQTPPQIDGTSEIQEIKVLGDWAFMWTKLKVVMTPSPGGAPVTRAGHTLTILNKQNGKWLLARDANLLSVQK